MHLIAVVALLLLAIPDDAAAYIDPAAGSLVLQLVLGGVAGLGVIAKIYWRRLKTLFRRGPDQPTPSDDEAVGREQ
jgi:hypothetical protein